MGTLDEYKKILERDNAKVKPAEPYFESDLDRLKRLQQQKIQYMRTGVKADPEQIAIDYYVPKQRQEEIKVESSNTFADIMDVIDNINRPFYAVSATAYETTKQITEAGGISDLEAIGDAFMRGLKREEKKNFRDILKVVYPESIKEIEKNTELKMFGEEFKSLNPDALTIPGFAADIVMDPLTYLPPMLPLSIVKHALKGAAKGTRFAAKAVIRAERVEKILNGATKSYIKNVAPLFNLKSIFKHYGVEDSFEILKRSGEVSDELAVKKAIELSSVPTPNRLLTKFRILPIKDSKAIFKKMTEMEDEAQKIYGAMWAKELGVSSENMSKIVEIKDLINDIALVENQAERAALMGKLGKELKLKKGEISNYISGKLVEGKKVRALTNKLARAEFDATVEFAKFELKIAKETYEQSIKTINSQLSDAQKALRKDIKLSHQMVSTDVSNLATSLRDIDNLMNATVKGEVKDFIPKMKEGLSNIRKGIGHLNKYGKKETLKTLRSGEKLSQMRKSLLDLEQQVNKAEKGLAGQTGKELIDEAKGSLVQLRKDMIIFKKLRQAEVKSLKGSARAAKELSVESMDAYKGLAKDLSAKKRTLEKEYHKQVARSSALVLKARKNLPIAQNKYHRAFLTINSSKEYQRFLQRNYHVAKEIFEKGLKDLPPEARGPARKLREFYDAQQVRLSQLEDPLLRGNNPLYSPREFQKGFFEQVKGLRAKGTFTSKGHLKKRQFKSFKDFENYAKEAGKKIEEDPFILAAHYVKDIEMTVAKHTVEKTLLAKLGVEKIADLPVELQNALNFMYTQGRAKFENPWIETISNVHATVLNTWKAGLTIINPKFHARNIMGFPFLSSTTAGLRQGFNPANYADAMMVRFSSKDFVLKNKKGATVTAKQFRDAMERSGYFASSYTRGDIRQSVSSALKRYSRANPIRWVGDAFNMAASIEDFGRTGAAIAAFKAGHGVDEAIELGRKAMFDYNLINSPADKALQGITGFYVWTRRNLPRQVMTILEDPKQYGIYSKIINRISNRESLSDEDYASLRDYEKENLKIMGMAIDGVRKMVSLGFTPMEQAYQTLNIITDPSAQKAASLLSPTVSTFLDFWYGKDSFYGTDFGNSLPAKYSRLLEDHPKIVKLLGLTVRERDKYRAGEVVGKEMVLYGDPNTIAMIRRVPIGSRFLSDLATTAQQWKEGKHSDILLSHITGARVTDLDIEKRKKGKLYEYKRMLREEAKKAGAKSFERIYIPKGQKKLTPLQRIKKKRRER